MVLLMMLHPTQELEPPANTRRFTTTEGTGMRWLLSAVHVTTEGACHPEQE